MWASTLLSPYLHPKLSSLGTELYKSPRVNARCALVYIPYLVGGPTYGLPYYKRGNRAMHDEVAPYISAFGTKKIQCLQDTTMVKSFK